MVSSKPARSWTCPPGPTAREELQAYGEEEIKEIFNHLDFPAALKGAPRPGGKGRGSLVLQWNGLKADYCSGFEEVIGHICRHRQRFSLLNWRGGQGPAQLHNLR